MNCSPSPALFTKQTHHAVIQALRLARRLSSGRSPPASHHHGSERAAVLAALERGHEPVPLLSGWQRRGRQAASATGASRYEREPFVFSDWPNHRVGTRVNISFHFIYTLRTKCTSARLMRYSNSRRQRFQRVRRPSSHSVPPIRGRFPPMPYCSYCLPVRYPRGSLVRVTGTRLTRTVTHVAARGTGVAALPSHASISRLSPGVTGRRDEPPPATGKAEVIPFVGPQCSAQVWFDWVCLIGATF